jgi:hypothetical protein
LQTLSILCQSVRNTTSVYYLLSNNYINDIISYSYDFEDDELVDRFISFMKSLSLRLNTQTVQFFFIEETGSYPLLSKAISFLSFKEPMVKTAAQATILNVYRIAEVRAREYALQDRIVESLMTTITAVLNTQYASMCDACFGYRAARPDAVLSAQLAEMGAQKVYALPSSQGSSLNYERQLESLITGFEDWMYYLQDMLDLKVPRLTRALVSHLLADFVQTTLLGPIDRCDPRNSNAGPAARPADLTQPSLSLFILCQMFRVITNPELHRAIMVAMLHPINKATRKKRIQCVLNAESHECADPSPPPSLAERLLSLGLGFSDKNRERERESSQDARASIESFHPELLRIREGQIADISSRLRRSSSVSSAQSLTRQLLGEVSVSASVSPESEGAGLRVPPPPLGLGLTPKSPGTVSDISAGDMDASAPPAAKEKEKEINSSRHGFELFFTNEDKFSLPAVGSPAASASVEEGTIPVPSSDGVAAAVEGEGEGKGAEGARCSLLACLALQSLCSSLLSLTERGRYDEGGEGAGGEADEDQLTASAFYIYAHLFQAMELWPVLSSKGELYPPPEQFWERSLALPTAAPVPVSVSVPSAEATPVEAGLTEPPAPAPAPEAEADGVAAGGGPQPATAACSDPAPVPAPAPDPADILEFESSPAASRHGLDIEEPMAGIEEPMAGIEEPMAGIRLDMREREAERGEGGEGVPTATASASRRTKPSDFDVSLELVFSASDAICNPFTSEPGVSIGAGKRLSTDGAALRPGEDPDYVPPGGSPERAGRGCCEEDVPQLAKKLAAVDWVDANIVPVPVLDALFEQRRRAGGWSPEDTGTDTGSPLTVPVLLAGLLGTDRAQASLPVMQVGVQMHTYIYIVVLGLLIVLNNALKMPD